METGWPDSSSAGQLIHLHFQTRNPTYTFWDAANNKGSSPLLGFFRPGYALLLTSGRAPGAEHHPFDEGEYLYSEGKLKFPQPLGRVRDLRKTRTNLPGRDTPGEIIALTAMKRKHQIFGTRRLLLDTRK